MKKTLFILIPIVLFSCHTQKNITVDYSLKINDTFDISLKANPTTGYSWKWIKTPNQIVDSLVMSYIQDKAPAENVGVGGKEIWKFKGKKAGIDTLTFEYRRSWKANSKIETKKFIVKIN